MRKFKFLPHLVENESPEALLPDEEPEGRRMDARLPVIGAAIFAAVVAAGGWNLNGSAAAPTADASAIQLTANSTVAPHQAASTTPIAPTGTRVGEASVASPSPSSLVPSPIPQREREGSRGPGASRTPVPGGREREDD
jgi:hypothetical protein